MAADGQTLRDLLASRAPAGLQDRYAWTVRVNGKILERESVLDYAPRAGDLITCRVAPREPVSIGIAILSAVGIGTTTAGIGAAAATFTVLGSAAIGTAFAYTVGSAVLVGANLLISKLLTPKLPKDRGVTGGASPFYSLSGARNEMRRGAAFQTHFGTMRVSPDLLLNPVSRVDANGDVTVKYTFAVGEGEYELADIRLRDTPIAQFNPTILQVYSGDGGSISSGLSSFADSVVEDAVGITLLDKPTNSERIVRTTAENCSGFTAILAFDRGIWGLSRTKGAPTQIAVILEVAYRVSGSADPWTIVYRTKEVFFYRKPVVRNVDSGFLALGQYDVSVQLISCQPVAWYGEDRNGSANVLSARVSDLSWLALQSKIPSSPFNDSDLRNITAFGIQLKATEVLSGALDQISVIARRKLPIYDSGTETWSAPTVTSNPAWAFAEVLRKRDGYATLDLDEVSRWAEYCDDQNWQFNHSFVDAGSVSVGDTAQMMALAGQAGYVPKGSLHSIALDELKSAPTAIFTGDKIADLTISRTFLDELHAVKVTFPNALSNYALDETTVYLPGYSRTNATEIQTLEQIPGAVYEDQVRRHVLRELARRRLRNRTFRFRDSFYDGLTIFPGDRIELAHASALLGLAEVRVSQYTEKVGGFLDEIELDRSVTMESGRNYGLRVALSTGAVISVPLVNPLTAGRQTYQTVTADGNQPVPTYIDDESVDQQDDLDFAVASFGELGIETTQLLVAGVEFDTQMLATITAVPYAPEVQTADSIPAPEHIALTGRIVAELVQSPPAPLLGEPRVSFRRLSDVSAPIVDVLISARAGSAETIDSVTTIGFRVQWRIHPDGAAAEAWRTEPFREVGTGDVVIPEIEGEQIIDVRVFAVSRTSQFSEPTTILGIATVSGVAVPSDITATADVRLDPINGAVNLVRLDWSHPVPTPGITTDIRCRREFGDWTTLPLITDTFLTIENLSPGEYEFELRARLSGSVSRPVSAFATVFSTTDVPTTPRPSGLELLVAGARAGNSREFIGRSATWVWNALSYDGSLRSGFDGMDEAPADALLDGWLVRLLDPVDGDLIREDKLEASLNQYSYSFDSASEDGLRRSIRFELRVRDRLGNLSDPAVLVASNSAPAALSTVTATTAPAAVYVTFDAPPDPDLSGAIVYASGTPGFTPGPSNQILDVPVTPGGLGNLSFFWTAGDTVYFRLALYDAFGADLADLNLSPEFSVIVDPGLALDGVSEEFLSPDLRRGLTAAYTNGFDTATDISGITAPSGSGTVTPGSPALTGANAALFTWNGAAPASTGTSAAPYLVLPPRTLYAIAGQRVRVQLSARQPASSAATQFRVSLDFGSSGNSGWQEFTTTTTYQQFSFLYAVPAGIDPANMRLLVQGDSDGGSEAGNGQGTLIDSVAVFPLLEQITSSNVSTHVAATSVGTSQLQFNSVSTITSGYTAGSIAVSANLSPTWTQVQTVSFTALASQPYLIDFGQGATTAAGGAYNFRILRNGAVQVILLSAGSGGGLFTFANLYRYVDTPGAGAVTYSLEIWYPASSGTLGISDRLVVVTELKR